jgi:hypothetical protein
VRDGHDTNLDDALPPRSAVWIWKAGYRESHWYAFQKASKDYRKFAIDHLLKPIFAVMEMVILRETARDCIPCQ